MTETVPPTPARALTRAQRRHASAWIQEKWKTSGCPFHGITTWEVDDSLGFVSTYEPGVFGHTGSWSYVFLVLTCQQCGYTAFVNALQAGVITREGAVPDSLKDEPDTPTEQLEPMAEEPARATVE